MSTIDFTMTFSSLNTTNNGFSVTTGDDGSMKIESYTPEAAAYIKQIFNRALNTWDDAPAEVKELGDLVTEGHVRQPYTKMKR